MLRDRFLSWRITDIEMAGSFAEAGAAGAARRKGQVSPAIIHVPGSPLTLGQSARLDVAFERTDFGTGRRKKRPSERIRTLLLLVLST